MPDRAYFYDETKSPLLQEWAISTPLFAEQIANYHVGSYQEPEHRAGSQVYPALPPAGRLAVSARTCMRCTAASSTAPAVVRRHSSRLLSRT